MSKRWDQLVTDRSDELLQLQAGDCPFTLRVLAPATMFTLLKLPQTELKTATPATNVSYT